MRQAECARRSDDHSRSRKQQRCDMHACLRGTQPGVLLRPLGHVVLFMPQHVVIELEINVLFDTALSSMQLVLAN